MRVGVGLGLGLGFGCATLLISATCTQLCSSVLETRFWPVFFSLVCVVGVRGRAGARARARARVGVRVRVRGRIRARVSNLRGHDELAQAAARVAHGRAYGRVAIGADAVAVEHELLEWE